MRRRAASIIVGVIVAGALIATYLRARDTRENVLEAHGEPSLLLMDFSTPFPLEPPPAGWFHRKFWTRAPMSMTFVRKEGVAALRMTTNATASMLFRHVDVPLADYPILKWSWFIEKPISSELDERTREGDDHPARFFLSARTPAGEERRFEIIWGNRLHRGETKYIGTFPHYVADGGDENVGVWREERVDLVAIMKMFWPDDPPARLFDIALFADSDDTKTSSVAYVADVRVTGR